MIDQSQIEIIQKDLKKYTSLDAIASQEGGRLLTDSLIKDIVSIMDTLAVSYRNLKLEDFMALCATMGVNLTLLRTLTRSEKNKEGAKKALEAALKE